MRREKRADKKEVQYNGNVGRQYGTNATFLTIHGRAIRTIIVLKLVHTQQPESFLRKILFDEMERFIL